MKYLLFSFGLLLIIGFIGGSYMFLRNYTVPASLPQSLPFIKTPEPDAKEYLETLRVDVTTAEYSYEPERITAKAGQRVELTMVNSGVESHDLVVEGTEHKTMLLDSGEIDTVAFSIDEPGEYKYFCSVEGHRGEGMEGVIVVE